MSLTVTDLFCGAGGSSTGAAAVPGVAIRVAANHWDLAVATHNTNHPGADHICADLSQIDPRYFPPTDLAWMSPSCTKHSIAQGVKRHDAQADLFGETLPDAAAERSRATMWDVVRFSEYHAYRAIVVENVVEVYHWPPFRSWLAAMASLGYRHRLVYLNSMHAQLHGPGAPQSRDRIYIVFWLTGNPAPDLDRLTRPRAVCPDCGPIDAVQAWKNPDRAPWGRYRAQYRYRCPNVSCRNRIVEPGYRPAAEIIDWTLPAQRIGDRDTALAAKTMARIQAGIDRYWAPLRPHDATAPSPCLDNPAGAARWAFIAELRGGGSTHRPVTEPLATVTASGNHHGLVTTYYGRGATVSTAAALPTVTTVQRHALITSARDTPPSRPRPTRTTGDGPSAAADPTLDITDVRFRMLEPPEIFAAMDFPRGYVVLGNRRQQVRMAGNAVTPPAARDLVAAVADTLRTAT